MQSSSGQTWSRRRRRSRRWCWKVTRSKDIGRSGLKEKNKQLAGSKTNTCTCQNATQIRTPASHSNHRSKGLVKSFELRSWSNIWRDSRLSQRFKLMKLLVIKHEKPTHKQKCTFNSMKVFAIKHQKQTCKQKCNRITIVERAVLELAFHPPIIFIQLVSSTRGPRLPFRPTQICAWAILNCCQKKIHPCQSKCKPCSQTHATRKCNHAIRKMQSETCNHAIKNMQSEQRNKNTWFCIRNSVFWIRKTVCLMKKTLILNPQILILHQKNDFESEIYDF